MKNTVLIVILVLTLAILAGIQQFAEAQSQAACYTQAGATKVVAGAGCEHEFQSGSVLDIQAGATAVIPASVLGQSGVLIYPTPNTAANCKQSTITDTVSYTSTVTAISTPQFGTCTLETITGDAEKCALDVGATGSITITVRNSNATPAANAAGAVVNWCVGGTP